MLYHVINVDFVKLLQTQGAFNACFVEDLRREFWIAGAHSR